MKVALLTVSDSAAAGQQADLSGPLLHKLVAEGGFNVVRAEIVPDDRRAVADWLRRAADQHRVDLALTSGGTGLGPRDVTPEATRDVLEIEVPGIAEAVRAAGAAKTPMAMLSRAVAGVRKKTLIINFSGSPRAVADQWAVVEPVIVHAIETIQGGGHHPYTDAARKIAPPAVPQAPAIAHAHAPTPSKWSTLIGTPVDEGKGKKNE
jgi:molybdenum cofactor synthesis domain-containing protein